MLEDDIEPPVVRWFHAKTADLPEQMRRELGVWLDVMRNGSTTPPRSKPRADEHRSAPSSPSPCPSFEAGPLTATRCARSAALTCSPCCRPPASPAPPRCRACGRSSASCESRKLVFTDPTFRIHVPAQAMTVPPAVDLAALRDALDSPSPARAVITALLAYHAVPMRQLAKLQLTDIRGGRLHLG